jgi:hypothetical protein
MDEELYDSDWAYCLGVGSAHDVSNKKSTKPKNPIGFMIFPEAKNERTKKGNSPRGRNKRKRVRPPPKGARARNGRS